MGRAALSSSRSLPTSEDCWSRAAKCFFCLTAARIKYGTWKSCLAKNQGLRLLVRTDGTSSAN